MSTKNYDEIKAIRSTQIKALAVGGPRSLWEATYGENETTASIQLGSMTHLRALQPEEWNTKILVESIDRRTKDGKARAAEVEAKGLTIVKPEEADKIEKIAAEWNKAVKLILGEDFLTEQVFTNTINGVAVKAQIDAISKDHNIIVDFKTVSDVEQAYREIWKRRYDLQLGFYTNTIVGNTTDGDFKVFLVFVETSSPFRCKAFDLTAILSESRKFAADETVEADKCLKDYGEDLNNWPQPAVSAIKVYPEWLSKEDN